MDYQEALKKVQSTKAKENFLIIKLGYDNTVVLPHKDGLVLMSSLSAAEQLNDEYNKKHSIGELDRSKITISQMSREEYERYKIATLLNLTLDEVKEAALQAS